MITKRNRSEAEMDREEVPDHAVKDAEVAEGSQEIFPLPFSALPLRDLRASAFRYSPSIR